MKTEFAKSLRRRMTDAERKLWSKLRSRQLGDYKFRRQVLIGPYVVDFVCFELKLVINIDGGQHAENVDKDQSRTEWLEQEGYRVFRFLEQRGACASSLDQTRLCGGFPDKQGECRETRKLCPNQPGPLPITL